MLRYLFWTHGLWKWLTEKTWPKGKYPPELTSEYYHHFNDGWHRIFHEMCVQTSKDYYKNRKAYQESLKLKNLTE